jgi:cytosolic 5'-nucleotidase 3
MQNIIISDEKKLNSTISKMIKDGPSKLHILSDFDRTLTKYFVNGKKIPSIIALIREGGYISPEYVKGAYELHDIYHPIEINTKISNKEKNIKMQEWWVKHFDLLIKSGMNKDIIKDIIIKNKIPFREGAFELFDKTHENNIPLIIMSATIGDIALDSLKYANKLYPNIHLIANMLIWDKEGKAIGVKKPIIHTLNKHETEIKSLPVYKELKKRKNVILIGDLIEDLDMAKGFPYKNIIKIGFLCDNINENLEAFKKNFDIVITNDSDMNYVNELLKKIIN